MTIERDTMLLALAAVCGGLFGWTLGKVLGQSRAVHRLPLWAFVLFGVVLVVAIVYIGGLLR